VGRLLAVTGVEPLVPMVMMEIENEEVKPDENEGSSLQQGG
jgi:hypothetical protein